MDCDISLQNHLAVANTRLLRAYGSIDSRVRTLVFLIKYWAKRRHLNSPSDGTLSSYGFIICLIHFLQVRSALHIMVLAYAATLGLERNSNKLSPCIWTTLRTVPFPWFLISKLSHPRGRGQDKKSRLRCPPRRVSSMTH